MAVAVKTNETMVVGIRGSEALISWDKGSGSSEVPVLKLLSHGLQDSTQTQEHAKICKVMVQEAFIKRINMYKWNPCLPPNPLNNVFEHL